MKEIALWAILYKYSLLMLQNFNIIHIIHPFCFILSFYFMHITIVYRYIYTFLPFYFHVIFHENNTAKFLLHVGKCKAIASL